jgi:hypothetical protein
MAHRRAHRARFVQAKSRAVTNSKELSEILGYKVEESSVLMVNQQQTATTTTTATDELLQEERKKTDSSIADKESPVQTSVSPMSMEEYFRLAMERRRSSSNSRGSSTVADSSGTEKARLALAVPSETEDRQSIKKKVKKKKTSESRERSPNTKPSNADEMELI